MTKSFFFSFLSNTRRVETASIITVLPLFPSSFGTICIRSIHANAVLHSWSSLAGSPTCVRSMRCILFQILAHYQGSLPFEDPLAPRYGHRPSVFFYSAADVGHQGHLCIYSHSGDSLERLQLKWIQSAAHRGPLASFLPHLLFLSRNLTTTLSASHILSVSCCLQSFGLFLWPFPVGPCLRCSIMLL